MINAAASIALDVALWGSAAAILLYMILEDHVSPPWEK